MRSKLKERRERDRDGCCELMALFPDWMVCGFRLADRSNGGRDETQLRICVACQTTHTQTHTQTYRVTTLVLHLNHRTSRHI